MDFGVSASKIDDIGFITRAESLGYSFCWVADTQMVRSNPGRWRWRPSRPAPYVWARRRCGRRLAPVTANGIATINRLAPDAFLGLAPAIPPCALGQKPMGVSSVCRIYPRGVRCCGEEVAY
jgi:hypothetical protein